MVYDSLLTAPMKINFFFPQRDQFKMETVLAIYQHLLTDEADFIVFKLYRLLHPR